jgi:hypothetical protein
VNARGRIGRYGEFGRVSADSVAVIAAVAYLLASLLATSYVRRRAFNGRERVLLVVFIWLVPVLGAMVASVAAWERGRGSACEEAPSPTERAVRDPYFAGHGGESSGND